MRPPLRQRRAPRVQNCQPAAAALLATRRRACNAAARIHRRLWAPASSRDAQTHDSSAESGDELNPGDLPLPIAGTLPTAYTHLVGQVGEQRVGARLLQRRAIGGRRGLTARASKRGCSDVEAFARARRACCRRLQRAAGHGGRSGGPTSDTLTQQHQAWLQMGGCVWCCRRSSRSGEHSEERRR